MEKPQVPENEPYRLEALDRYELLDTPSEQEFDDLTKLASYICDTPIALVSLVDKDRQWFKAKVGLDADETPRDIAFCAHAIHGQGVFVVENALEDLRFHDNPLVAGDPGIRFYAGAPLITQDGYGLGTLCAIDRKPRVLTAEQQNSLAALSRQVVRQMELRLLNRELKAQNDDKIRLFGTLSHDLRTPFNGLIGYSQMLQKSVDSMDEKRIKKIASSILMSSKNAFEQLESLLYWCQSQLNAVSYEVQKIGLAPLFTEQRMLLNDKIVQKNISFNIIVSDTMFVMADPALVRSVIQNLLTNAMKFTPEKGQVSLLAKEDSDRIRICVEDTGVGLTEEQITQLQSCGRTRSCNGTMGEKGTGLGLQLVHDHLARMSSRLSISSKINEGSAFSFILNKA